MYRAPVARPVPTPYIAHSDGLSALDKTGKYGGINNVNVAHLPTSLTAASLSAGVRASGGVRKVAQHARHDCPDERSAPVRI